MTYNGPVAVSDRTVGAVMRLLGRQQKPMSITQLSEILGKSYNTIKAALSKGGAVAIDGSYPKVFTLPELYEPERVIGDSRETVNVPYVVLEPQVARWNENRHTFAKNLGAIEITKDAKPDELAEKLTQAAKVIASLAFDIAQRKDMMDWYEKLGGVTDEGQ